MAAHSMPEPSGKAPDIHLPAAGGESFSLSAAAGKKAVVLYFYPKDDTPGCTQEAKDFSELADAFTGSDTLIVGISKDDVASHEKFIKKHALSIILASDADGDVCERYGVWVEKNMYGKKYMGIQRATFLIDKAGNVAAAWPKVKVAGHAQEVLKAAQSLR